MLIIYVDKKTNLYLSGKEEKLFKEFFKCDSIRYLINSRGEKEIYKNLFVEYANYLASKDQENNLLLRKALPYFLLWIGFDFRKEYSLDSHLFYFEAFLLSEDNMYSSLKNYPVGIYYEDKTSELKGDN